MSQVGVGAAVVGPVVIGAGALAVIAVAGFAVVGTASLVSAGVGKIREMEERRKAEYEAARRKALLHTMEALRAESFERIRALRDEPAKRSLEEDLEATMRSCRAEIESGRSPDALFREFRRNLLDAALEEEFSEGFYADFGVLRSKAEENLLPASRSEWDKILRSLEEVRTLPRERRIAAMPLLLERANEFARRMSSVQSISLDGISEEVAILRRPEGGVSRGGDDEIESLRASIADFAARIAFFDGEEAGKHRHLLKEAADCASVFRLSLIRDVFMTGYGKAKEAATLTASFKQEIRELLPLLKKARNAESMIVRMEELLEARNIPREAYSPVYTQTQRLLAEQMESMVDAAVARKVEGVLEGMGYALAEEVGSEGLREGEIRYIETPYDGYRVRLRVDGGKISTRLVRVAADEKEARSGGEYQRRKDVEAGESWCRDLDAFYAALENEGIFMANLFRKEPDEELVEVVVDERCASRRRAASRCAEMRARP